MISDRGNFLVKVHVEALTPEVQMAIPAHEEGVDIRIEVVGKVHTLAMAEG